MQKRIRNLEDKEILQAGEYDYFDQLLDKYPTGILSIVSDTFDLWSVLTLTLPLLKNKILARDGKLVIRPDSGDPVDIICGVNPEFGYSGDKDIPQNKGVIELLWDIFGGTINDKGYKVLDSHIGAIYGDSITLIRAKQICERLEAKGFASINIVLGIGSMTYTGGETTRGEEYWITRDLFGFAMKATYGEITHKCMEDRCLVHPCDKTCVEAREIFKDPITDNGEKKSKKGLLRVQNEQIDSWLEAGPELMKENKGPEDCWELQCKDQCTKEEESTGLLTTVFLDGKLVRETNLETIRAKLSTYVNN